MYILILTFVYQLYCTKCMLVFSRYYYIIIYNVYLYTCYLYHKIYQTHIYIYSEYKSHDTINAELIHGLSLRNKSGYLYSGYPFNLLILENNQDILILYYPSKIFPNLYTGYFIHWSIVIQSVT